MSGLKAYALSVSLNEMVGGKLDSEELSWARSFEDMLPSPVMGFSSMYKGIGIEFRGLGEDFLVRPVRIGAKPDWD